MKRFYSILVYFLILQGPLGTIDKFAAIPFYLDVVCLKLPLLSLQSQFLPTLLCSLPKSSVYLVFYFLTLCPIYLSLLNQKTLGGGYTNLVSDSLPESGGIIFLNGCLDLPTNLLIDKMVIVQMFNCLRQNLI